MALKVINVSQNKIPKMTPHLRLVTVNVFLMYITSK